MKILVVFDNRREAEQWLNLRTIRSEQCRVFRPTMTILHEENQIRLIWGDSYYLREAVQGTGFSLVLNESSLRMDELYEIIGPWIRT